MEKIQPIDSLANITGVKLSDMLGKDEKKYPTGNCFFCGNTTYNGDRDCKKCDNELSHADDYKQEE